MQGACHEFEKNAFMCLKSPYSSRFNALRLSLFLNFSFIEFNFYMAGAFHTVMTPDVVKSNAKGQHGEWILDAVGEAAHKKFQNFVEQIDGGSLVHFSPLI